MHIISDDYPPLYTILSCVLEIERAHIYSNERHLLDGPSTHFATSLLHLYFHAQMDMQLETEHKPNQLTLEGCASIDAFSTPDDLKSLSPAEDLILEYAEDPPALVAYVAHIPHTAFEMTNLSV